MSDFKAKMHYIRFPLGLRWSSLLVTGLPQIPWLYLRSLFLRRCRRKEGEGNGRRRKGKGEKGGGGGGRDLAHPIILGWRPLMD